MTYAQDMRDNTKERRARLGIGQPAFEPVRGTVPPAKLVEPATHKIQGRRPRGSPRLRGTMLRIIRARAELDAGDRVKTYHARLATNDLPRRERILIEAALAHGLRVEEICDRKWRAKPVVAARQEVWWRYSKELELPANKIGRMFGMDHATVMYGIRKIDRLKESGNNSCENSQNSVCDADNNGRAGYAEPCSAEGSR